MDVNSFIIFEKYWRAIYFDCDYDVKFLGLNNIPAFYTFRTMKAALEM